MDFEVNPFTTGDNGNLSLMLALTWKICQHITNQEISIVKGEVEDIGKSIRPHACGSCMLICRPDAQ